MTRALLALYFGLVLLVRETNGTQLTLPPVPHYEDPFPLSSLPPIKPPLYTQQDNRHGSSADERNDEQNEGKTIWQWFIATYYHTIRDPVALFTFVLSVSTVGLWIVTGIAGKRQSREIRASTKVAEDAVAANLEALAHAKETAAKDFRPWLTLDASLISPVAVDPLSPSWRDGEEEGFAFFIELRCRNVGKIAAVNVVYGVSGIDIAHNENGDVWFQELIDASIHACKFAGPQSWRPTHSLENSSDALVPSEEYKAKRWCQIPPLKPDYRWKDVVKERRVYQFCVGIVAAYSSVGSDEPIFYTAKVLPIGKINLPEFLGLIGATELPVGTDEVGIGPTYKAIAT